MVDRWVAVKKVVKSLYLKWIDHFYSLLIEVSFESICNDSLIVAQINATIHLSLHIVRNEKRCTWHLSCFSYLLGQEE